ncbi:hypothetical protein L6R53_19080 [Myxococcota bacterium]|nr:hypothetical protein [Myxococcota bacterium]
MAAGDPRGWTRRGALQALAAASLAPGLARAAGPALPSAEALAGWQGPTASWTARNATVQLHDGTVLRGAGLRVEDGVVVEIATRLQAGEDLDGAWLCPGLVDAGSPLGLYEVDQEAASRDDSEGSAAVTPDARVVDAWNPRSELVPVARTGGVSHALVLPAGDRLVAGQAALLRLVGRTVDEATVRAPVGLCVNLGRGGTGGEGAPRGRMGVAMRLRELLEAAEPPPEEGAGRRRRGGPPPPAEEEQTAVTRVWRAVRARELRLLVQADRADDLLTAVRIAREFQVGLVLVGAAEAWLVALELAAAGVPVLLGPVDVQPDSFDRVHARYDNAAALHAAGVPFALRTGAAHNSRLLPTLAGLAVAHGLPREAAIHAITAAVGQILDLPAVGRLEVGAPANLVQVAGDPLQPRYPVQRMWIDGRPVSLETRQTRLYERFRELR